MDRIDRIKALTTNSHAHDTKKSFSVISCYFVVHLFLFILFILSILLILSFIIR